MTGAACGGEGGVAGGVTAGVVGEARTPHSPAVRRDRPLAYGSLAAGPTVVGPAPARSGRKAPAGSAEQSCGPAIT